MLKKCIRRYFFSLSSQRRRRRKKKDADLRLVDFLTAEREVTGSIPGAGLRNEGTAFALQAARPSRGSDDHEKWRSRLQLEM